MKDLVLGTVALAVLATSLGLARIQLFGPPLPLLSPYRPVTRAAIRQVTPAEAFRLFEDRGALFIDARETERYEAGHVPGAVNLEPDTPVAILRTLPLGQLAVIYCDGPECGASARLADRLAAVTDPARLLILAGGWPAWDQSGYPLLR